MPRPFLTRPVRAPAAGSRPRGLALGVGFLLDLSLLALFEGLGLAWSDAQLFAWLTAGAAAAIAGLLAGGVERLSRSLARGALAAALSLGLRGALLAVLIEVCAAPRLLAWTAGVGASWLVVATTLRLSRSPPDATAAVPSLRASACALIVYTVVLRWLLAGALGLLHEEAYYWNYAQHPALGYLDHPPLVGWLILVSDRWLGTNEFAVRLPALLCWFVTALYAWRLARSIGGGELGVRALLLLAVLPGFFATGLVMTPDAPLMACWSGALFHLHRALIEGRRGAWIGVGIFVGLGLLAKYTILLLPTAAVLFLLCDRDARAWLRRPEPYVAGALALGLASPVIAWNAANEWISFRYQSTGRLAAGFQFSVQDLIGGALVLLTPVGIASAVRAFRPLPAEPHDARTHRLLLATVAVPFSVFLAFSLVRLVKLNWTAPLWLGVLPSMAAVTLAGRAQGRWASVLARSWPPTVLGLLVLWSVGGHWLALGLPGLPGPPAALGAGQEDLARQVETAVSLRRRQSGEEPWVVCIDGDQLASWLAFYRARAGRIDSADRRRVIVDTTTGGHMFGYDGRMYARWHPAHRLAGRPIVLVTSERARFWHAPVGERVDYVGWIRELAFGRHGREAGRAYLRPARFHAELQAHGAPSPATDP